MPVGCNFTIPYLISDGVGMPGLAPMCFIMSFLVLRRVLSGLAGRLTARLIVRAP